MTTKELIIQKLETVSASTLDEVLSFLLQKQQEEEQELAEDLADLRTIREEIKTEGTIPWEQVKQELGLTA